MTLWANPTPPPGPTNMTQHFGIFEETEFFPNPVCDCCVLEVSYLLQPAWLTKKSLFAFRRTFPQMCVSY